MAELREKIFDYCKEKYGACPEYLWARYPDCAVLRNKDNKKWFAITMDVSKKTLGLSGDEKVGIINVKSDEIEREFLLRQKGILPAYHMNKMSWITVLLDGSVPLKQIKALIDESVRLTTEKKVKKEYRSQPKSWLAPVNPKYYDIVKEVKKGDDFLMKQSGNVIKGDTVYIYVAAPYSAVMFKCSVGQTDIPYEYGDKVVKIKKAMKVTAESVYSADRFPFERLNAFGVMTVRGQRGVPYGLRKALERESEGH